jgi:SAM-dependent MidA family methyltransferase
MDQLSEIIIQRIKEDGPISFHDFMEMALYYPGKGYYANGKTRIGKSGDFYTSSDLTPAFGWAIGRQLEEMWEKLGRKNFTVVEYGQERESFVMISSIILKTTNLYLTA